MSGRAANFWRRLKSDRGSVFAEYAYLTAAVTLVALSAFSPDSKINEMIGADYNMRQLFIKLPFF